MGGFKERLRRQILSRPKRSSATTINACSYSQDVASADPVNSYQVGHGERRSGAACFRNNLVSTRRESHSLERCKGRSGSETRGCRCFAEERRGSFPPGQLLPTSPTYSPVYSGELKYLDSRQRWKRREVRCDGRTLVCLRTVRVAVADAGAPVKYLGRRPPEDISAFDLTQARKHASSAVELRCSFAELKSGDDGHLRKPQCPSNIPPVNHPLFATPDEDVVLPTGGFAVRYFQDARWTLRVSDITAVTRLAQVSGERIAGAFVVHTDGSRTHVFRAANDVEATLWIGLLTMCKAASEAVERVLPPTELGCPPQRQRAAGRERKTVSWVLPKEEARERRKRSTICNCSTDVGTGSWKQSQVRENQSRPPRTDSLLHSITFKEHSTEPPDEANSRGMQMRLNPSCTKDKIYGASRRTTVDYHHASHFPAALYEPPFPEVQKAYPAPLATVGFLPPPQPQRVPPLQLGSLITVSPRRTINVSKIYPPKAHQAILRFTPLPENHLTDGTDSESNVSVPASAEGTAAAQFSSHSGFSIPHGLIAGDIRREILSRARYLLREIRCASGFIPVPSVVTSSFAVSDADEARPRSHRRRHLSALPRRQDVANGTLRVSRIPVIVALEHLDDVVHAFISGDLEVPAFAEEGVLREDELKGTVRRLASESMRRAHRDVMKLVGEGGNLADSAVFETATASVELLTLLFSTEGLLALKS